MKKSNSPLGRRFGHEVGSLYPMAEHIVESSPTVFSFAKAPKDWAGS
jgi:hypothetical protein